MRLWLENKQNHFSQNQQNIIHYHLIKYYAASVRHSKGYAHNRNGWICPLRILPCSFWFTFIPIYFHEFRNVSVKLWAWKFICISLCSSCIFILHSFWYIFVMLYLFLYLFKNATKMNLLGKIQTETHVFLCISLLYVCIVECSFKNQTTVLH